MPVFLLSGEGSDWHRDAGRQWLPGAPCEMLFAAGEPVALGQRVSPPGSQRALYPVPGPVHVLTHILELPRTTPDHAACTGILASGLPMGSTSPESLLLGPSPRGLTPRCFSLGGTTRGLREGGHPGGGVCKAARGLALLRVTTSCGFRDSDRRASLVVATLQMPPSLSQLIQARAK